MIRSMTGYGRGECFLYNRRFTVEIKSVNHRYSDINVKLPRTMNSFEEKLRKKCASVIFRGKTDVYVSLELSAKDDVKVKVNEALADAVVEGLRKLNNRYGIADDISLSLVSQFPDVITVEKGKDDEKAINEMWEALEIAAGAALDHFIKMREVEGQALKNDMLGKLSSIQALTEKIRKRAPLVAEDYKARLKTKLDEALGNVAFDENRVLTEITIFADRACIDEEITRLFSHITQMESIVDEGDSVGRKLDFLVQEMNREINTIGSKSNDLDMTKMVVEMKSEVEKIREQIQNIE